MVPAVALTPTPVSHVPSLRLVNTKRDDIGEYARKIIRFKAWQLACHIKLPGTDIEDLEQALTLHLLEQIGKFDAARAQESTFVARIIKNKAASMLREYRALKRRKLNDAASLNSEVKDADERLVERHQTMAGKEDFRKTELRIEVAEVLERLPRRLRRAAELLMQEGASEAAKALGVHRCTLHSYIIKKLREAFENAGFDPAQFGRQQVRS